MGVGIHMGMAMSHGQSAWANGICVGKGMGKDLGVCMGMWVVMGPGLGLVCTGQQLLQDGCQLVSAKTKRCDGRRA